MNDQLQALAKALITEMSAHVQKHDLPVGVTQTTNYMHGPGGIFGVPGLERDIFSTRVQPTGLLARLPANGVNLMYPVVGYLTGFTSDRTTTEKSGICDKPIEAGQIKSCMQGSAFGRIERMTEAIELNRIGQANSRAEFFDLRIVNDPLLRSNFGVSDQMSNEFRTILNREVLARWYTLGASFEQALAPMIYDGDFSGNTAGGGYKEFAGLENLVGTGKIDVFTAQTCPSLDSYIRNFNYASINSNLQNIFVEIVTMVRNLEYLASSTGLAPVNFKFVMRMALFNELVDRWPCVYATFRCDLATLNSAGRIVVDGMDQRNMTDAMRNGRYLLVDGKQYEVIIDDAMPTLTSATSGLVPAGSFASDIYFLPFVVKNGIPVLYLEYFDYNTTNGVMQAISDGRLSNEVWTTDAGRFLWTFYRQLWCVAWAAKIEPRLRLLTPHLAGRISNVVYSTLVPFREPFPNQPYFVDGGAVVRSGVVPTGTIPYDIANIPG